jgi:hypothetical protein
MTIDQVRDVVRTEPVRRLVEVAPSGEDVRHAIGGGLEALSEGLGSVAEQVDRSAEAIRERIAWAEQLARPAPARRSPWPAIAIVGIVVGLAVAIAVAVSRVERARWTALRARATELLDAARGTRSTEERLDTRPYPIEGDRDLHAIKIETPERHPTEPVSPRVEDSPLGSAVASPD